MLNQGCSFHLATTVTTVFKENPVCNKHVLLIADKRKKSSKSRHKGEDRNTVMLRDVFGVNIKKKKATGSQEGDGVCVGRCV